MDSYGYSFLAAVFMLLVGQHVMAGLCFVAGILAPLIPTKKNKEKQWEQRTHRRSRSPSYTSSE